MLSKCACPIISVNYILLHFYYFNSHQNLPKSSEILPPLIDNKTISHFIFLRIISEDLVLLGCL